MTKPDILRALGALIASRPGLEAGNYSDARSYRADMYRIRQQRRDAERFLADVALDPRITDDDMTRALKGGRVTLHADGTAEYIAGQYYPVEYRAGVARLLADLLWWAAGEEGRGDRARAMLRRKYGKRVVDTYF